MIGIFATQFTGGTTDALDYTDGALLSGGEPGIVCNGGVDHTYILNASSGATADGFEVIAPTTNAGAKRWILQKPYGYDMQIGTDQSWQNVLASRIKNVTYTNSTSKPICVSITAYEGSSTYSCAPRLVVDGLIVSYQISRSPAYNVAATVSAIVPPGSTYEYADTTTAVIQTWHELRG